MQRCVPQRWVPGAVLLPCLLLPLQTPSFSASLCALPGPAGSSSPSPLCRPAFARPLLTSGLKCEGSPGFLEASRLFGGSKITDSGCPVSHSQSHLAHVGAAGYTALVRGERALPLNSCLLHLELPPPPPLLAALSSGRGWGVGSLILKQGFSWDQALLGVSPFGVASVWSWRPSPVRLG